MRHSIGEDQQQFVKPGSNLVALAPVSCVGGGPRVQWSPASPSPENRQSGTGLPTCSLETIILVQSAKPGVEEERLVAMIAEKLELGASVLLLGLFGLAPIGFCLAKLNLFIEGFPVLTQPYQAIVGLFSLECGQEPRNLFASLAPMPLGRGTLPVEVLLLGFLPHEAKPLVLSLLSVQDGPRRLPSRSLRSLAKP